MIALKTTIQTLTMTYIRSTLRYYYTYIRIWLEVSKPVKWMHVYFKF